MKRHWVYLLVSIIILLSICNGCGNLDEQEVSLAIIVGAHANAPDILLDIKAIEDELYDCSYTYGSIAFIELDGDPNVYYQTDIPSPEEKGLTERKKKEIASKYTDQLMKEIIKVSPVTEEVDILKAIDWASMTLSEEMDSDKKMVIMDPGLSTTGYLDFTRVDLLNTKTSDIIEMLRQYEAIPELDDISVVWMFAGQTASPQPELSKRQKNKLREIWNAILLEGGAKEVKFAPDIAFGSTDHNYPKVSVVEAEEIGVVLDNMTVQFVGDEAIPCDEEDTKERLKKLADQLKKYPEKKMYVIGTTASGEKEFCQQLSDARAQYVVNELISCGISESRLIPIGLGYEDPWHIDDLNDAGGQIEEKACQNRKVLIIDAKSEDAGKLE